MLYHFLGRKNHGLKVFSKLGQQKVALEFLNWTNSKFRRWESLKSIKSHKTQRDIIDNKWIFIMFSSVFYFFFNVAYTSLSFTSIITSLCYLFSMMLLSSYYYKTNNFTASVLVMMIYNIIISILSFI